jgi:hypothetical protein
MWQRIQPLSTKHTRQLLEAYMVAAESSAEPRKKRQVYRCFLVRCRLEEGAVPDTEPAWRFSVQEAGPDAARRSFACLKDVEAYLEAQLGSSGKHAAGPEE